MSLKVVGCCNGLLCLTSYSPGNNYTKYYAIVNPSIGSILSDISFSTKMYNVTCSGFGYHTLNKDYKLVVVEYQYHHEPPNLIAIHRKVHVFSMKSNSWRCIETTYLGGSPLIIDSNMCIPIPSSSCALIDNYLMHWLLKSSAGNWSLVCFNLDKERWVADIRLPDFNYYDGDIGCDVDLGVLDGCLCFSVQSYYDKFNVWIMKEYGVHGSWTKFFIDIPDYCDYYPIFARQHTTIKEILLAKCRSYKRGIRTYVWYNIRDKTAKELRFIGAPHELGADLLCIGSLANCFEDCQTKKCKGTQKRMETQDNMKIDDQVKILQANMSNNNNVIRS
ncbi:hypothetical protein BVRB_3g052190 [Beta vulgaris subsp. vulgaris]|nr:hypothetical protein BVRB_3g052190 [Beta vulgaris subsp. vulgaris]